MVKADLQADQDQRPSLLPFDPKDLVAMRVRPADFARMCSVSKQTVSVWIKRGTVTLGPDGLLDPTKAAREVMQRTDPARIRARLFKLASASHEDLREKIKSLEAELSEIKGPAQAQRDKATERRFLDQQANCIFDLCTALVERFGELVDAHRRGGSAELDVLLDSIIGRTFYADTEDEPEDEQAFPGDSLLESQSAADVIAADRGSSELHQTTKETVDEYEKP